MENINLTIEDFKRMEPRLCDVEHYVMRSNSFARRRKGKLYWYDVWARVKYMQMHLIGWFADCEELRLPEHWDAWHNHLKALAFNLD